MKINDPVWGKGARSVGQRKDQRRPKVTTASEVMKCWGCNGPHRIAECQKMEKGSSTGREMLIRTRKFCFNCLKKGHISIKCPSKVTCSVYKKRHHLLLHEFTKDIEQQAQNTRDFSEILQQSGVSNAVNRGCCTMHIIPVKLALGSSVVERYAFLDSGSNVSFIT